MAVQFTDDAVTRADSLYSGDPADFVIEPDLNGRHDSSDVEALAADIELHGQLQPVTIRKNDAGLPVLVAGHRRYRAICLLNERNPESPRKLIARYQALKEDEAFLLTISENRFRRDISPIDDATNIKTLTQRFGKTMEDCAKVYFPEAQTEKELASALRWVKQRAILIELSPETAQAVRDGNVKVSSAMLLAKLSADQQKLKLESGKTKTKDITPKKSLSKEQSGFIEQAVWLANLVLGDEILWDDVHQSARSILKQAKKLGVK